MAKTQNQPKSKENVNLNQPSTLRSAHMCVHITVHNCHTQISTEQF